MDWTPGQMSQDVEDRRGGGGGFGGGGLGIIGFVFLLLISLVTGRNYIGAYLSGALGNGANQTQRRPVQEPAAEDRSAHLVSWTLDDVQKTWTGIFQQHGKEYRHAKLVLFRDYTQSGCGVAQSQTGPFYCPEDEKVYIDLGFWDDLARFGGSTADFAQSYVIAHELGHHVQNLLGTEQKVTQFMQEHPAEKNHASVDLELQADCFAGVWAHSAEQRNIVHAQDVKAGLSAAAAVGDDHMQKMMRGAVSPETFTHGTSAQRMYWFTRGMQQGTPGACNTFQTGGQIPAQ